MAKKQEATKAPALTNADRYAAFIDGLVQNHTITADAAGIIKHAIEAKKDELNK